MENLFSNSNPRKKILGQIFRVVLFIVVLCLLFELANFCLYDDSSYIRLMLYEMYNFESIDAVFIGSSAVYRTFAPYIWDKTLGVNTFNLGSSGQTPEVSYHIIKELFKTQKPKYCIYGLNYLSVVDYDNFKLPIKHYI